MSELGSPDKITQMPPREPQSYTPDELKNPLTRRQFLIRVPAFLGSAAALTAVTPDLVLNGPVRNVPPMLEEGEPIQVEGGKIRLINELHFPKTAEAYNEEIRRMIRNSPFVFFEYFDEEVRPNALPTTTQEAFKDSETFGDATNKFYSIIGKMCAEEGKDVIVVNPETSEARYAVSFLTAGLAAGASLDTLLARLLKQPMSRRTFLKLAAFIPTATEAGVWTGKTRGLQEKLVQLGIMTSDLPEKERANVLGWSILDWRDIGSAEGMEKALEQYKDEIPKGSIAPAFNGAAHRGMAEYLKNPRLRELKSKFYGPYNAVGEKLMRRYTYNKEQNVWELKEKVPY